MPDRKNPISAKTEKLAEPGVSGSSLEMVLSEEIGRTIKGRYQITDVIGEGGMGVVYEAYDTQVDRNVAIKLVRNECLADRKFLTRFRRELEVTTQLRHPSTIRVFEHGEAEDGRPYMVMELLRGESLAERLERGRVPEVEALQYARQIAESLSEAHEAGIFHRDLKPDNLFIETVGVSVVVKVLDFGIAGGIDASRLTQAGEVFGTPQYMSPEQCNGLALDHRTDIYSLGCILYEMLEGKPPFSGENPMATMLKHVKNKVPQPKHCCRETAKVLQMCLRKDRGKRIQDCGQLAEMLGNAIGAARAAKDGRPATGGRAGVPKRRTTGGVTPVGGHVLQTNTGNLATNATGTNKMIVGGLVVAFLGIMGIFFFTRGDEDAGAEDAESAAASTEGAGDQKAPPEETKNLPKNRARITASEDGATVFLDGEPQCETPCFVEVPVGDGAAHELRLRKEGFVDEVRRWEPASVTASPPVFPDLRPSTTKVQVDG